MPTDCDSIEKSNPISSAILNFYQGRTLFVTGATGFLGKVLVEKLLFSCTYINKIYILINRKNGKTIGERFSEYFDSEVFQRVKDKNPDLMKKVVPINGNLEETQLGISEHDLKLLQNEVSVVFHSAAKLIFNMSVAGSVTVNTKSTQQLIAICKRMRNIAAFVYVSSAYSNANRQVIDEKVYHTGISLDAVYETIQADNTKGLIDYLLDGRPNAYTYSKALAEELVEKEFYQIPATIVRPSIIGASNKEPMPGWIQGWQGLTCAITNACRGELLIWHGDPGNVLDVVPVDQVANLLIAVGWDTSENRLMGEPVKVFNYCSGTWNPIELDHLINTCCKDRIHLGKHLSSNRRFTSIKNYVIYKFWLYIYHVIPAFVADTLCWLTGRKPKMTKTLKKHLKLSSVLEYFTQHQYLFMDSNVRRLFRKMEETDRSTFNFEVTKVKWDVYLHNYVLGIRKYLQRRSPVIQAEN